MWSNHWVLRHIPRRLVCKLKKSLYGLKQAPRTWYGRIDSFLSSLGFTKSKADSNLYFKVEDGNPVMLLLYVDDLFVTGMEVWQSADGIFLGQGKYVVEILKYVGSCSASCEAVWLRKLLSDLFDL